MSYSDKKIVYTLVIGAGPEKVWQALTTSEFTRQYWAGAEFESDWRKGSQVTSRYNGEIELSGEILEADPPRRLSYTWKDAHWPDLSPMRVVFEIEPVQGLSILTVVHDRFEDGELGEEAWQALTGGWPYVLSGLKTLLETGKPLGFDFGR